MSGGPHRGIFKQFAVSFAVVLGCALLLFAPAAYAVQAAALATAVPLNSLPIQKRQQAVYGSPIRNSDGTIAVESTVKALKARGTDVVNYLIYNSAGYHSDLDVASLPEMLRIAKANNMKVWVTLVPPSEGSSKAKPCTSDNYPPYYGQYDKWMNWLAGLRKTNSNLSAVIMDDFDRSFVGDKANICQTYKTTDIARWKKLLSKSGLQLGAVMYQHDFLKGRVYGKVSSYLNFVIWPYTDLVNKTMGAQFDTIQKTNPKARIVIMVFARAYKGNEVSLEHAQWSARAADYLANKYPSRVLGTVYYQPIVTAL